MKNIVKLAIGVAAITAGTIVAGHMVKKHQERKYVTPDKYKTTETKSDTSTEDDMTMKERIVVAATEKVMDILCWASNHEKELKGLTIMLAVAGGAVDLALGLKKVGKRSKLFKKIDDIHDNVWRDGFNAAWDEFYRGLNNAVERGVPFVMSQLYGENVIEAGRWVVKEAQEAVA